MVGMLRNLVFVCPKQFGYLSDYYYYCKYLNDYNLIYICKDQHFNRIDPPSNTRVYHLSGRFFLIKAILLAREIQRDFNELTFIIYYQRFCSIFPLIHRKGAKILDIRTGFITKYWLSRNIQNYLIKVETSFYRNVFLISESLKEYLKIQSKKVSIVPLGAIEIGYGERNFNKLSLIYVGTLFNRNIPLTIEGLAYFKRVHPEVPVSYTIIGFGPLKDIDQIKSEIEKYRFYGIEVKYLGRLHHKDLETYFKCANIGVSFIPEVEYFDCQPPTKTYEYLCSGLVCLATATSENKKIITQDNGLIINDNPTSFAQGLASIWSRRSRYDTKQIKENAIQFHWSNVVKNHLQPALKRINDK